MKHRRKTSATKARSKRHPGKAQRRPAAPDIVAELLKRRDKVSREAAKLIEELRRDVRLLRERGRVSDKIMAGLRKARREGKQLGGRNVASERNEQEARQRAEELRPIFTELAGLSARAAADALNRRKVETPEGGRWHSVTVLRVRARLYRIDQADVAAAKGLIDDALS